jgi:hypothetical protein
MIIQRGILPTVVAVPLICLWATAASAQSNFACPATLSVAEQVVAPNGWNAVNSKIQRRFKTAKLYNGNPGKDEFDLKPDDQVKQGNQVVLSWNLRGYRDMNVFVRCFYQDTSATLAANVPQSIVKCSVVLEMDSKNRIIGTSRMKCE